jgi:hypothetical protein
VSNYEKYWDMWKKWKSGQITRDEWMGFCVDFLGNEILTDPDIVAVMKRVMKRDHHEIPVL